MKTHYDWNSRKLNEEDYTRTICGMKDPLFMLTTTLNIRKVTCKNCLKKLKYKN